MGQSTKSSRTIEAIFKRLEALVRRKPEMAEAAAFYRAITPALQQAQAKMPSFTLDPSLAEQKLAAGRPLLVEEDLPFDSDATTALFLQLCRLVENIETSPTTSASARASWSLFKRDKAAVPGHEGNGTALRATAVRQIRRAIEQNQLDLGEVWAAVTTGDEARLSQLATALPVEPGLLEVLAQNSLKPAFQAWAEALSLVELGIWHDGRCPLCGNTPTLAEIVGKEGQRRLRCARCGAGWYYPRLKCPFCYTDDYKSLGYIAVEDEAEKYRLQTCETCRGYLKVVVTYDPIPVALLFIEDLATVHLDWIANERGFTRAPAPSARQ